jgi:GT2 family glycosyltransferase
MSSVLISVVITTYNRPDALTAVVEACFAQDDLGFEIIIADDGSGHNTQQAVAALQARSPVPLRHVWQEDRGFRAARAQPRHAGRPGRLHHLPRRRLRPQHFYQPAPQAGAALPGAGQPHLAQRASHGARAAPAPRLGALSAADKLAWRRKGELNKVLPLLFTLPDVARTSHRFSWRRIKSCNLAVWRSDLELVNGFDESFLGWGHEDSGLVVRLFNAGVMRKDGAYATEVFHLWHKENARDQETSNRATVLQRAADRTVLAVQGLRA